MTLTTRVVAFLLVVAEPRQHRGQPDLLGDPRGGELRAALRRQERLQKPLVLRIRNELDDSRSYGLVREPVGRLPAQA
jgi:hypothetical protein